MVKHLLLILMLSAFYGCATHSDQELKVKDPTQKKAELYYDYGTSALVNKDYTKALINLKKAIELIDDNSHFHNNLGMAYYFKGDSSQAIKHLEKSIDLDEKNSDAKINLASIYFNQGKLSKARELYLKVSKDLVYGKQFRTYYNLGLIYLQEKRVNKAIAMFKKSIAENKSYCPAHFKLGEIAIENHNYFQSANHFENAYSGTCNKNPTPYFKEALSYYHLGEYGKALVKFEIIEKKFPESKEAVLAKRQIKAIKINELKNNRKQALQYELNKIKNKYEESLQPETGEKKVDSLQF